MTALSWELRKRSVSTIVATTVCVIACLGVQASPTLLDIAAGKRQPSSICCGFLPFLIDNLCLNCACKSCRQLFAFEAQKGKSMQNGSMIQQNDTAGHQTFGNSDGENLDLMANANIAVWYPAE